MIRFLFLALLLCSCSTPTPREMYVPPVTPIKYKDFHSAAFDTTQLAPVMKGILTVLQDDGYVIRNVNQNLGFISATKEIDTEKEVEKCWSQFMNGDRAHWYKNRIIEVSFKASVKNQNVVVRALFQQKNVDNRGLIVDINDIENRKFYTDFFIRVEDAIQEESQANP